MPSSLWDSVSPIDREIWATFGQLSLCIFEPPCQRPPKHKCIFPACFLPHPSGPPLRLADKLFLVSCKLHCPLTWGTHSSLCHIPQGEEGTLSLLVSQTSAWTSAHFPLWHQGQWARPSSLSLSRSKGTTACSAKFPSRHVTAQDTPKGKSCQKGPWVLGIG